MSWWEKIRFVIPGDPRGKQRPRVTRAGHAYTPSETVAYEKLVIRKYWEAANKAGGPDGGRIRMTERPVMLFVTAYYGIPKNVSKVRRKMMVDGELVPTRKPDLDNVVKIVMDGLNGQAYRDDKQVVNIIAGKKWSDEPCVEVIIKVYVDDRE